MMNEHVDDLIDLEALGALDADESARVRAHVLLCDDCRRSLDQAREVVAQVGMSAPLRIAPLSLRARVLTSVATEAFPSSPAPVPISSFESRQPQRLSSIHRFTNRWGALAAAIVVVPLAGLLTWAVILQTQVNSLKQENRQIQEAQQDLVILAGPTAVRDRMIATEAAPGARGLVSWIPDDGKCVVAVRDLPKLDQGASYHVFYQGMKGVVDAGEIKPNDQGNGDLVFDSSKWRGDEYRVWVSAVRPGAEQGVPVLRATLRRD